MTDLNIKPLLGWTILGSDNGMFCGFYRSRGDAIEAITSYYQMKWPDLRSNGYKCLKVQMRAA